MMPQTKTMHIGDLGPNTLFVIFPCMEECPQRPWYISPDRTIYRMERLHELGTVTVRTLREDERHALLGCIVIPIDIDLDKRYVWKGGKEALLFSTYDFSSVARG